MTTSTTADRFFNVHTEAMGYLSKFEERNGKNGKFHVLTFCMIEGKASNADSLYVSCTVACQKALEILKPFGEEINNRDLTVFCGLRIAKFRADPFQYLPGSAKAGQLGVNYSANLIKLMYLKVADREIKLPKLDAVATTDYGVPVTPSVQRNRAENHSDNTEYHRVELSKDDPNFEITKQRLKDEGYQWNSGEGCWRLPTTKLAKNHQSSSQSSENVESTNKPIRVELSKDDPNFEITKQQLKDDGYQWNSDESCWQLPTYTVAENDPNRASKERDLAHMGYVDRGQGVWRVVFGRSAYQKSQSNRVQAA